MDNIYVASIHFVARAEPNIVRFYESDLDRKMGQNSKIFDSVRKFPQSLGGIFNRNRKFQRMLLKKAIERKNLVVPAKNFAFFVRKQKKIKKIYETNQKRKKSWKIKQKFQNVMRNEFFPKPIFGNFSRFEICDNLTFMQILERNFFYVRKIKKSKIFRFFQKFRQIFQTKFQSRRFGHVTDVKQRDNFNFYA